MEETELTITHNNELSSNLLKRRGSAFAARDGRARHDLERDPDVGPAVRRRVLVGHERHDEVVVRRLDDLRCAGWENVWRQSSPAHHPSAIPPSCISTERERGAKDVPLLSVLVGK